MKKIIHGKYVTVCDVCLKFDPRPELQFLPPKKKLKSPILNIHRKCEKEGRRKFPWAGKRHPFDDLTFKERLKKYVTENK